MEKRRQGERHMDDQESNSHRLTEQVLSGEPALPTPELFARCVMTASGREGVSRLYEELGQNPPGSNAQGLVAQFGTEGASAIRQALGRLLVEREPPSALGSKNKRPARKYSTLADADPVAYGAPSNRKIRRRSNP